MRRRGTPTDAALATPADATDCRMFRLATLADAADARGFLLETLAGATDRRVPLLETLAGAAAMTALPITASPE